MSQAGLDPDGLAALVEVDAKTVSRWLSGRAPYARHRAKVARALAREEHELWPELANEPAEETTVRGEIVGAWANREDDGAPDWRALLDEALDQVTLLDFSLLDILAADAAIDALGVKAAAGCNVTILISAPDSIWVTATAHQLGQPQDHIGQTPLQLEIEAARGHLERLAGQRGIEIRQYYAWSGHRILRFDDQLLVTPRLQGQLHDHAPVLHLRRHQDGGLFDQFVAHLEAIATASQLVEPSPELYPDPAKHPDRYEPLTRERYEREMNAGRERYRRFADGTQRPTEQVRGELRRPN